MTAQQTQLPVETPPSLLSAIRGFRQKQAYKNKAAEWVMLTLFVSGLLLWETLPVSWPIFRSALFFHVIAGLIIFPLTTGLFWWAHRRLLVNNKKPFLRITGQALDWLLGLCFLTGLILSFWGATGNVAGEWISNTHWMTGLLLGPLMLRHAWRFSVLRHLFN